MKVEVELSKIQLQTIAESAFMGPLSSPSFASNIHFIRWIRNPIDTGGNDFETRVREMESVQ